MFDDILGENKKEGVQQELFDELVGGEGHHGYEDDYDVGALSDFMHQQYDFDCSS